MIFIAFLIFALVPLFGQLFGWQAASFDLNDPEAAKAKYADIGAIESLEEQGWAWCSLTDRELRAIAAHTEMSNTVTTTTHTSSAGETTATVVFEPAPNQEALVESAVRRINASCRYNAWANFEKLQTITDEEEWAELVCPLTAEEVAAMFLFISPASSVESEKSTKADGESTETTISRPWEPVDESELAAMQETLSAECGWDDR